MHLKECGEPYVDISLHKGQFWARSTASCEVVSPQMSLDGVQPRDARAPTLVVSSSSQVGEPLGSSWHLHRHPYMQYA